MMTEKILNQYYRDFPFWHALGVSFLLAMMFVLSDVKRSKESKQRSYIKVFVLRIIFVQYIISLLWVTIFDRVIVENANVYLRPFWSYKEIIALRNLKLLKQVLLNIIAFIPWGVLLPSLFFKIRKVTRVVGSAFVFSILIEIVQFCMKCGLAEFDDVFHNIIGAIIGYFLWRIIARILAVLVGELCDNDKLNCGE